jgi:hypothetical protein
MLAELMPMTGKGDEEGDEEVNVAIASLSSSTADRVRSRTTVMSGWDKIE